MGNNETDLKWFAIRVTYSREMALKGYLDQYGIESFIPMQYKEFIKGERKVRKLVPVIHNLVFVRLNREKMDEIKADISLKIPIRYIMNRERREPLVVPDRQMYSFIAVAGAYNEQVVYLDSNVLSLREGDRVRITGGVFAGVEGVFLRIKGDRRVVVSIEGVMAVATAFVHPSLIERVS
ncbi:UpxY family transcription antiterminator [Barnesiella viscericola]|uniref:UpxY family transcription antiterminator n=1 Tax=Barnesiella viscericola TaxID=397865 RepID=UPI00255BD355|nr:UpxY family transcription antiterminator [Barnesiella viscericola]